MTQPHITEPHVTEFMTMLTDYLLAIQSVALAVFLYRKTGMRGTIPWWVAAFLVTALAALAGGTAHGFALYLGQGLGLVWAVTVWSIAASAALLIACGVGSVLRPLVTNLLRKKAGHNWLWRAVILTLSGLAVQQSGWSLHEHFNYNDLYHVVQMAGLYCLYRGALTLNGSGAANNSPAAE